MTRRERPVTVWWSVSVALLAAGVLLLSLGGRLLSPHDPVSSVDAAWLSPQPGLPLGTDGLGRDVWSRVLSGGLQLVVTSIVTALLTLVLAVAGGVTIGWASRGAASAVRLCSDLVLMLPFLLLAMVLSVRLPGPLAIVLAGLVAGVPITLLVVADLTRRTRATGYVEAAIARGESTASIVLREVLPGMRGYLVGEVAMRFVVALQVASALSLLGLGPAPPAPDWGVMLRENLDGVTLNPYAVAAPAMALALLAAVVAVAGQLLGALKVASRHRADPVSLGRSPSDVTEIVGDAVVTHRVSAPTGRRARSNAGHTTSLLQVRGLCVDTAQGPLLQDVNLDLSDGEVLALRGPSGSGKTTLALAILDALGPGRSRTAGQIRWRGEVVDPGRSARRWRRENVQWVSQDPASALNPVRSAVGLVGEGNLDSSLARRILSDFGVDAAQAGRRVSALSGGQAQRVALARAIAAKPALLVVDEPTSAVDPATRELIRAALELRRGHPGTTVVISHDSTLVSALADRVLEVGRAAPSRAAHHPRTRGAEVILELRGLTVPRGSRTPVHHLDVRLCRGEIVAVIGASGVGKTSMLRATAGLLPHLGYIELGGEQVPPLVRDRPPSLLRAIQFVGQDPLSGLNPALSVQAQVARAAKVLLGLSEEDARLHARSQLEAVGLGPRVAERRPGEISGGQRQRAVLARALVVRPRVLLADEVTSALDAGTAGSLLDLLQRRCAEEDVAVLLVTHDRDIARRADRVLELGDGTLRTAHEFTITTGGDR